MPRPKKEQKEEVVAEQENIEVSKESVSVVLTNSTRVFSKEVHGDDFLALAKSFASKFNGKLS